MQCLILAFESFDDLPKNWRNFDVIDAYGASKLTKEDIEKFVGSSKAKIRIFDQFFEIKNFQKQEQFYNLCFIRHPDPWGEPRNWLQAIAALGECLQGRLACEFWFPHEVVAFDFLLTSLLGEKNVKFLTVKQIENVGNWKNYSAEWEINSAGVQSDMSSVYQTRKQEILQKFYKEIGQNYYDGFSFTDIRL